MTRFCLSTKAATAPAVACVVAQQVRAFVRLMTGMCLCCFDSVRLDHLAAAFPYDDMQQQQQHYNTLVLNVYYLLEYIVDFISHHRRSV